MTKLPRGGVRKEHRKASMAFSRQLLAEHRAGASIRALASKYGLTYSPVYARIERARSEEFKIN